MLQIIEICSLIARRSYYQDEFIDNHHYYFFGSNHLIGNAEAQETTREGKTHENEDDGNKHYANHYHCV